MTSGSATRQGRQVTGCRTGCRSSNVRRRRRAGATSRIERVQDGADCRSGASHRRGTKAFFSLKPGARVVASSSSKSCSSSPGPGRDFAALAGEFPGDWATPSSARRGGTVGTDGVELLMNQRRMRAGRARHQDADDLAALLHLRPDADRGLRPATQADHDTLSRHGRDRPRRAALARTSARPAAQLRARVRVDLAQAPTALVART